MSHSSYVPWHKRACGLQLAISDAVASGTRRDSDPARASRRDSSSIGRNGSICKHMVFPAHSFCIVCAPRTHRNASSSIEPATRSRPEMRWGARRHASKLRAGRKRTPVYPYERPSENRPISGGFVGTDLGVRVGIWVPDPPSRWVVSGFFARPLRGRSLSGFPGRLAKIDFFVLSSGKNRSKVCPNLTESYQSQSVHSLNEVCTQTGHFSCPVSAREKDAQCCYRLSI